MTDPTPPLDPTPDATSPPDPARRRLVVGLAALVALLLVGAAVTVPLAVARWRAFTTPTLDAVRVYDDLSNAHVGSGESVDYDPAPPPGGPHDGTWLACGVYDEPVRDENAVHSLEHGTVWLTYDPDELSGEDVAELAAQLPAKGILSPYPGQESRVVATVWGRQLYLRSAGDERLGLFLDAYADGHTAPEPLASCEGGERILESDTAPGTDV